MPEPASDHADTRTHLERLHGPIHHAPVGAPERAPEPPTPEPANDNDAAA